MVKKRDRIIASIRKWETRYLKKIHKFGKELPETVKLTLAQDDKNGNTLWQDAISKELENVRVRFEILLDMKKAPIGHQLDIRPGLWKGAT